jgi:hypothetical protein
VLLRPVSCYHPDCERADVVTLQPGGEQRRACIGHTLRALELAFELGFALTFELDAHVCIPLPPAPAELHWPEPETVRP